MGLGYHFLAFFSSILYDELIEVHIICLEHHGRKDQLRDVLILRKVRTSLIARYQMIAATRLLE